ncbi:MAG: DegV family protein [Bacillaceae bacterium]
MNKIKIVTDSTVDLDEKILEQYNIEVMPLSITINGTVYVDRVDITPEEFLVKMQQSEELPKTSQPPIGGFVDLYEKLGEQGYDVISIHMTSGMSGTYSTAQTAANMVNTNVTVVDSQYISKGLSFQVLEAAKMAEAGATVEEIVKRLDEIKKNTTLFVVVDQLDNLVKGGRMGKGVAFLGSLLNIKPIASLTDGVYNPIAKARSKGQIIKILTKHLVEDTQGKTIKGIGITHADAIPLAESLKKSIEEATGFMDTTIEITTPIVSTHTGVGAIGFSYYWED